MNNYFHIERTKDPYNAYLWVRLLDKDGKTIHDLGSVGCHGVLKANVNKATATINVYRKKSMIPYDLPEIKRWIADLNELGFPCELKYDEGIGDEEKQNNWANDTVKKKLSDLALPIIRHGGSPPIDHTQYYNFYVHLKDYANKTHLFSTLQLMRVLYETQLARVPEKYFQKLDKEPKTDKFQLIQDCHKEVNGFSHAITYNGNGANIKHKTLMERFKKKDDFFTSYIAVYTAWNGDSIWV